MEGIRVATEEDYQGIRHIWEERFTDDDTYLNTLFSMVFPHCKSYIYIRRNCIVSAITLMPILFETANTKLEGYYMFGVATLKRATGEKLAQSLILKASEDAKTEGFNFIIERPANQGLNSYYFKLGFTESIYRQPHLFKTCSSKNNPSPETLSETSDAVLQEITASFNKRFIWNNKKILNGLIALGELEYHNANYSPTPENETYLALKNLSNVNPVIFQNTFFCFPME